MINFQYENFINFGFLKAVLSEEQIKPIKEEINFIKHNFNRSKKHNKLLAGNIEKEYTLEKSHDYLQSLLLPLVYAYLNTNNVGDRIETLLNQRKDLKHIKLLSTWVNFQKKYEFNPVHNHDGVLSFVIWIDIPFFNDNEAKELHVKDSNTAKAGVFSFLYQNILGVIECYDIPADKNYNNGLILFPAKLHHVVYPFSTSNESRISVAGNFGFITNE